MEQISEMANEDRSQQVKIIEAKQKGKTLRSRVKYTTQNELEMARLRHQETQSALQCQHDLVMIDRQMEVERIRGGLYTPPHIPGGLHLEFRQFFFGDNPANFLSRIHLESIGVLRLNTPELESHYLVVFVAYTSKLN